MASSVSVGFVGLGVMGGPMSTNLLKAGHAVIVLDTRKEAVEAVVKAGATAASTPRELAQQTDVVVTSLPSLHAIEDVYLGKDGLLSGARKDQAFFETSTNDIDLLKKIHAAFAAKGAHVLDAPVSGGALGARRGKLGAWIGGDQASYHRYEAVLKAFADQPTWVGEIGSGLVTKLVNNCISHTLTCVIDEIFVMGVKAGAEPLALWAAVRQGALGRRRTYDGMADEFLPARYEPANAAFRIIQKDLLLATGLARQVNAPMRFANIALADIMEGLNRGWAEKDYRAVALLCQERIGVSIKVDPKDIDAVFQRDPPAPTDTKRG